MNASRNKCHRWTACVRESGTEHLPGHICALPVAVAAACDAAVRVRGGVSPGPGTRKRQCEGASLPLAEVKGWLGERRRAWREMGAHAYSAHRRCLETGERWVMSFPRGQRVSLLRTRSRRALLQLTKLLLSLPLPNDSLDDCTRWTFRSSATHPPSGADRST